MNRYTNYIKLLKSAKIAIIMHCPFCTTEDTKVIDSRLIDEGGQIRRRRECLACGERFNTYERAELSLPQIIKRDGRREGFDEDKLRDGLYRALEKRPVSTTVIDDVLQQIKKKLCASSEREITSKTLGEWMMQALRELDEVAYVRFASVYRSFQDVADFRDEIKKLQQKND